MISLLVRQEHLVSKSGQMIDVSMEFLVHMRSAASAAASHPLLRLKDVLTGRRGDSGRAVLAALLPQTVVEYKAVCGGLDRGRGGSRGQAEGRDGASTRSPSQRARFIWAQALGAGNIAVTCPPSEAVVVGGRDDSHCDVVE